MREIGVFLKMLRGTDKRPPHYTAHGGATTSIG